MRGYPSTTAPLSYLGSSSSRRTNLVTSRSPASKPASIFFFASGDLSNSLTTIGFSVRSRNSMIKAVCVPLPAPSAPFNQKISAGNFRFSAPTSFSSSCQTEWKISWASFTSMSSTGLDECPSPTLFFSKGTVSCELRDIGNVLLVQW